MTRRRQGERQRDQGRDRYAADAAEHVDGVMRADAQPPQQDQQHAHGGSWQHTPVDPPQAGGEISTQEDVIAGEAIVAGDRDQGMRVRDDVGTGVDDDMSTLDSSYATTPRTTMRPTIATVILARCRTATSAQVRAADGGMPALPSAALSNS